MSKVKDKYISSDQWMQIAELGMKRIMISSKKPSKYNDRKNILRVYISWQIYNFWIICPKKNFTTFPQYTITDSNSIHNH